MSKKIVVIMNDDPRELRTVEINTVYKSIQPGCMFRRVNKLNIVARVR